MTKHSFSMFIVGVSASLVGCATSSGDISARGTVLSTSPGARAIVRGPAALHAYAGFSGGEIYAAPSSTGSDADCVQGPAAGAPPRAIPADKVVHVTLEAGSIACLRTRRDQAYELVWHALAARPDRALLATSVGRTP